MIKRVIDRETYKYGRIRGIPYRLWINSESIRKEFVRRLHNPLGGSRPVFLVGCGRSGTNMITRHLARSWQIKLYNEDNSLAFKNWRMRDLRTIKKLVESNYATITLFKPILDTHLSYNLLSYFDQSKIIFAYRYYTDVVRSALKHFGPDNWYSRVKAWVEKDFEEFFPAMIPKNLKDFIIERWYPSMTPETSIALYWLFYNCLYFDLELECNPRVYPVKYENVVLDPTNNYRSICNFLGIRYNPLMADGVYNTSLKHDLLLNIDQRIRDDCEDLWNRLCDQSDHKIRVMS
jgi:hypothetical protein